MPKTKYKISRKRLFSAADWASERLSRLSDSKRKALAVYARGIAMKTSKKPKSAAVLTIHAPGNMDERGRKAIADWLRRSADDLQELGAEYTLGRFTARYLY